MNRIFQNNCLVTENNDFDGIKGRLDDQSTVRLLHASLGVVTESAEFADVIKKHVYYGKPLDKLHLKEELGDILYYCAIAADALGIDLDSAMEANTAKLRKRYPEGFESSKAITRDVVAEYKAMEE